MHYKNVKKIQGAFHCYFSKNEFIDTRLTRSSKLNRR